jgi:hypothetical protein
MRGGARQLTERYGIVHSLVSQWYVDHLVFRIRDLQAMCDFYRALLADAEWPTENTLMYIVDQAFLYACCAK